MQSYGFFSYFLSFEDYFFVDFSRRGEGLRGVRPPQPLQRRGFYVGFSLGL
jgi:hypothetical protein